MDVLLLLLIKRHLVKFVELIAIWLLLELVLVKSMAFSSFDKEVYRVKIKIWHKAFNHVAVYIILIYEKLSLNSFYNKMF